MRTWNWFTTIASPLASLILSGCAGSPTTTQTTLERGEPDPWHGGRRAVFRDPLPFGPQAVSFPLHCTFSSDGAWVAFVQGDSISIWDARTGRLQTLMEVAAGGFEIAFAGDSRRVATVAKDAAIVFALGREGWALDRQIPLGFATVTNQVLCPRPLYYDGRQVLFAEDGVGYNVDLAAGSVGRASRDGETVFAYMNVPDDAMAEVRTDPLQTRVSSAKRGERTVPGALVCACEARWLIASEPKYPYGRLDVSIVTAWDAKEVATFSTGWEGGRGRGDVPRWQLRKATFSRDGGLLAAVEAVDVITVRGADSGLVQVLVQSAGQAVAFGPDGECILTANSGEGTWLPGVAKGPPAVLLWRRTAY